MKYPAVGEPFVRFQNDFIGRLDIKPNGSYSDSKAAAANHPYYSIFPEEFLFLLPGDSSSRETKWEFVAPHTNTQFSFTAKPLAAGTLDASGNCEKSTYPSYNINHSVRFKFDISRGRITEITNEVKRKSKDYPSHTRETISLIAVLQHDEAWMQSFEKASHRYFELDKQFWQLLLKELPRANSRSDGTLMTKGLRTRLVRARESASLPILRELYQARIKLFDRDIEMGLAEAEQREALFKKPPVDWETTDFNGKQQRLVDYRGKVVLLDFWYKGCSHCLKAIPKVKQLAKRYQGKDLVVLGINSDRKDEDARFVIKSCGIQYPTLRGKEIVKQYDITCHPSFVLLDQSGRVALVVNGNSPSLVADCSRVIDRLLVKPVPESPSKAAASGKEDMATNR